MPRCGCSRRDMTPIRRPLTPKTLPHMVPSGMEFAPGRTVRILPRRSAEAALGRQRGPPRIDPESSPRDGKRSPRCNGTGAARNAAHRRGPAGWCLPASQSLSSSCRLLERRSPKPRARRYLRASRQPRGQRRAARPAAALRLLQGERARAYPSVHVQHKLQACAPWQTCESKGCRLQPCCAQQKEAQQRPATR